MLKFAIRLFEPCFRWTGRIDRRTFCGSTLLAFVPVLALCALVSAPLAALAVVLKLNSFTGAIGAIYPLVAPAFLIIIMSALVTQRAHDLGRNPTLFFGVFVLYAISVAVFGRLTDTIDESSPHWSFFALPLLGLPGLMAFFVLVFQPGQKGPNKYGSPTRLDDEAV